MLRFFIKGILRDRQRSLLPIITVTIGVMLAVFLQTWVKGVFSDMVDFNARFSTGHVKVMSRVYYENLDQLPNDLALLGSGQLMQSLQETYPDMEWTERISFGGLLDSPDENGETKAQGPTAGMAIDFFSENSGEIERLNLNNAIVRGEIPQNKYEVLLSEKFSVKMKVNPGDRVTLIGSTMYGAMSITNFTVAGTINFGVSVLDRGGIIADINGVRDALDMQDATSEVLGYFSDNVYNDEAAIALSAAYNEKFSDPSDKFSPQMVPLRELNNMSDMLDLAGAFGGIIIFIFVMAMSIVLWNAGLLGGIRRYGEMGLRLAIGERKGHIYRSLINESIMVGFIGSILGTAIGLGFA
ncbi:MAG: FtsX-like permease family protein [Bacteroidales bacterium]|jgi:putative ABC transport system permease protein|nr:FtsX-like permease family protein [Bacteroidales bacterium]